MPELGSGLLPLDGKVDEWMRRFRLRDERISYVPGSYFMRKDSDCQEAAFFLFSPWLLLMCRLGLSAERFFF